MNKHAIVILYSGVDRDPGYDVIESLASVITQAGLAVPELIEIKHFDSDSIGKAIIAKSAVVESKEQPVESELIKQSVIYFVEKYKHLTDSKRYAQILKDAYHGYKNPVTEDEIAFKKAMDTIASNQQKAVKIGMSKKYVEMIVYIYEFVNSL